MTHSRDRMDSYRLSVPEAVQQLRTGKIIQLCGSSFEDDNVLCQAAQFVSREMLGREEQSEEGQCSVVLAGERIEALQIPLATGEDAVRIAVKALSTSSTLGRIDEDMQTVRALIDPVTRPQDLAYMGRIMVWRAHPGGTLECPGYREAAIDLMRMSGLALGVVIRKMSAGEAERYNPGLLLSPARVSVDAIVRYRREHRISFVSETRLPTAEAVFSLRHYQEIETGLPYLALTLGDLWEEQVLPPLLRLHSACMTGDVFGSQRCDCQAQLHTALRAIAQEKRGMLLYLPQEGRGIGLAAKLHAYVLQEQGYDTLEANAQLGYPVDARSYDCALEILHEMKLHHVRLMTNNPQKIQALVEDGIVVERIPLETQPTSSNAFYLQTKRQQLGHLFDIAANEL